jgi:tetratricopeptide (TPR) repeat protein
MTRKASRRQRFWLSAMLLLPVGIVTVVLSLVRVAGLPIDHPFLTAGASASVARSTSSLDGLPWAGDVRSSYLRQVSDLEARLEANAEDTEALKGLARLLAVGHQSARAVELLERLVGLSPGDPDAWLELGRAHGSVQEWQPAKAATERVLELNPDNESARYNLGAIAANLGAADEAATWWIPLAEDGRDGKLRQRARDGLAALNGAGGA